MPTIDVAAESDEVFIVMVGDDEDQTRHRVTAHAEFADRLLAPAGSREELVRLSFEFLLEREPKESILREFDISVIARYFPEYEVEIRDRLRG